MGISTKLGGRWVRIGFMDWHPHCSCSRPAAQWSFRRRYCHRDRLTPSERHPTSEMRRPAKRFRKTGGSLRSTCAGSGSWEGWRPDKDRFPASVIGKEDEGWPDEKWLDVRQIETLAPIMRERFDLCRDKGVDGIEPDNMEGYTNGTGFPLTHEDEPRSN